MILDLTDINVSPSAAALVLEKTKNVNALVENVMEAVRLDILETNVKTNATQ